MRVLHAKARDTYSRNRAYTYVPRDRAIIRELNSRELTRSRSVAYVRTEVDITRAKSSRKLREKLAAYIIAKSPVRLLIACVSIHGTLSYHEEATFGAETGSVDRRQVALPISTPFSAFVPLTPWNSEDSPEID